MAKLALDFDGTIHDPKNVLQGYKMGRPVPGAQEALKLLRKQGHEIIIFPTWADNSQRRQAIMDWLKYFNIEFDDITSQKPDANLYIDNNAIRFETWAQTLADIEKYKPYESDLTFS